MSPQKQIHMEIIINGKRLDKSFKIYEVSYAPHEFYPLQRIDLDNYFNSFEEAEMWIFKNIDTLNNAYVILPYYSQ